MHFSFVNCVSSIFVHWFAFSEKMGFKYLHILSEKIAENTHLVLLVLFLAILAILVKLVLDPHTCFENCNCFLLHCIQSLLHHLQCRHSHSYFAPSEVQYRKTFNKIKPFRKYLPKKSTRSDVYSTSVSRNLKHVFIFQGNSQTLFQQGWVMLLEYFVWGIEEFVASSRLTSKADYTIDWQTEN